MGHAVLRAWIQVIMCTIFHPLIFFISTYIMIKRGDLEEHYREFSEKHLENIQMELEITKQELKQLSLITLTIPNFDCTETYVHEFQLHGTNW